MKIFRKPNDLVDEGSIPPESIPDPYLNSTPVMPDIDISVNGLLKLLKNLKPGKAAGPDQLKPLLLKELRDEIAPVIKVTFDKSLQTGTLPTEWLTANVMPVFKKGDKSLAANYKPISLTCILCKVLEHILASNIVKHLDAQEIMYDMQRAFREKRSCETQLVMMIEDLARNVSAGNQTDVILLDFSKAFDKVSHSKLLWKLHQYGIRGKVLSWIQAFLGNRSQQVVIDGEESDSIPVNSGVPQGSVLGPILSSPISTTCLVGSRPKYVFLQTTLPSISLSRVRKTARHFRRTWTHRRYGSPNGTCSSSHLNARWYR